MCDYRLLVFITWTGLCTFVGCFRFCVFICCRFLVFTWLICCAWLVLLVIALYWVLALVCMGLICLICGLFSGDRLLGLYKFICKDWFTRCFGFIDVDCLYLSSVVIFWCVVCLLVVLQRCWFDANTADLTWMAIGFVCLVLF